MTNFLRFYLRILDDNEGEGQDDAVPTPTAGADTLIGIVTENPRATCQVNQ